MRVVFLAAIFDLLHHGHVNLLKEMRLRGDRVIIILHDDASCYRIKGKIPVQSLKQRIANVKIVGLVDEVMVTKSIDPAKEFEKIIKKYKGHDLLYMRGDDLTENFPGQWMLKKHGVPILFVPYTKGVSSSQKRDEL